MKFIKTLVVPACKCLTVMVVLVGWISYCKSVRNIRLQESTSEENYVSENLSRLRDASIQIERSNYKPPEHPNLHLAFVSVKRTYGATDLDYLTQAVGSFLRLLNETGRQDVKLTICDATTDGDATNEKMKRIIRPENIHKLSNVADTVKDKELKDYIACLKKLSQQHGGAEYIVLNEDDGIPIPTFISNVFQIMHQMNQRRIRKGHQDVSHIKLFHPVRLRKLPWLIYTFVAPIFLISIVRTIRCCFGEQPGYMWYIWYSLAALCIGIFLFSVGPEKVGWWHHKLVGFVPLVPQESCCTVSVLFPQDTLNRTVAYMVSRMDLNLKKGVHQAKDGIMDSVPWDTSMKVLMTEFNFAVHIGKYSSIRN